jgi:superoxide dismutase, Fe-Mn family
MQNTFKLTPLPWNKDALVPFLSSKAITLIYDGIYVNHVKELNALSIKYPELQKQTIYEIVINYPSGTLFNNIASEILNHEFFFRCLSPEGGIPSGRLYNMIVQQYESFENFVLQFTEKAVNHFASGWIWLVYDPITTLLIIIDRDNAYNPIIDGYIALLTLDLWEHSFLLDYGVDKLKYVSNFWRFVNWVVIEQIVSEKIFNFQIRVG